MRKKPQHRIIGRKTSRSGQNMNLVEEVEQGGYAIIPDILSESETGSLAEELSGADIPRSRAGIRHVMRTQAVSRVANREDILEAVKTILGKDAVPFRATLFDKSPESNWLVMWHQDTALPLLEKKESDGWGPWSVKD